MTVLAAAGLLITASCSTAAAGPTGLAASPVVTTTPTGSAAEHNDQDVRFAQMMIPHHRQALEMTKLAATRAASEQVKELASQIEAAQGSEIQTMSGWLTVWGEQVPDDTGPAGHDMPGMLSEQEMKRLESLSGPGFDKAFLELMIKHHEGAVTMAEEEQRDGAYAPAKRLASSIVSSQKAEIAKMRELLQ